MPEYQWLTDALAEYWKVWLPASALQTIKSGGYYTTESPISGLRIISINSQFNYLLNFYFLLGEIDPENQFQWLIDILTKSEEIHEKVLIIGHIPCPIWDSLPYWCTQYTEIAVRFSNIIVGHLYGHTHLDQFTVILSDDEKNCSWC